MSYDHISTEEIKQDILDTRKEIIQMACEIPALRTLGDRLSIIKADYRVNGIKERAGFIEKLEAILKARGNQ